jgi:hypothetical protein
MLFAVTHATCIKIYGRSKHVVRQWRKNSYKNFKNLNFKAHFIRCYLALCLDFFLPKYSLLKALLPVYQCVAAWCRPPNDFRGQKSNAWPIQSHFERSHPLILISTQGDGFSLTWKNWNTWHMCTVYCCNIITSIQSEASKMYSLFSVGSLTFKIIFFQDSCFFFFCSVGF